LGAVALVYTCVVLHEFGHALTARKLGIPVQHIVLLPFGGMALLGRLPRSPRAELLIVAAGPAVNFAIAGLALVLLGGWPTDLGGDVLPTFHGHDVLEFLLLANLVLGCFNLLPAFPMDGGRILRALLAIKLDYLRATRWALYIGRGVAVAGIVVALIYGAYLLAGLFTFILWIGKREYDLLIREETP
jgi:Zn-dependent protease